MMMKFKNVYLLLCLWGKMNWFFVTLVDSFYFRKTEQQAVSSLYSEIESSVYSLKKFLKNEIHQVYVEKLSTIRDTKETEERNQDLKELGFLTLDNSE